MAVFYHAPRTAERFHQCLAARKAWLSLVTYINEDDNLTEVCEGTGTSSDRNHYMNRHRNTGDLHGQAPVMWCAVALLR